MSFSSIGLDVKYIQRTNDCLQELLFLRSCLLAQDNYNSREKAQFMRFIANVA